MTTRTSERRGPEKEVQMSKLDQVVFVIEAGEIIEGTIRSFDGYIDETTTPHGVSARYHVRGPFVSYSLKFPFGSACVSFDGLETEAEAREHLEAEGFAHGTDAASCGKIERIEKWQLWNWGHQGSFPSKVSEHDTKEEAIEALEDTFEYDFWNCADILAFATREEAEECLAQNDD